MSEPIYIKIEKYLKELIDSGEIKQGEILPSENKLCEKFNVTRMTVRSAFNNLVKEGYITRKRGIGSIVLANRISDNIGTIEGYTKEMINKGYNVTTKLISLSIVEADKNMKNNLRVELGENLWEVKRVRYAEGSAVSYMITYMPVKMFPNLKKNGAVFASPIVSKGVTDFNSAVFATTLEEVEEGDKITMTIGDVNRLSVGVRGGRTATYLTVEVIE